MNDDEALRSLWKQQPTHAPPAPTAAAIEATSRAFARRIRRRNLREYVAVVLVVPIFVALAVAAHPWLVRAGAALVCLATVFVTWWLRTRGRPLPPPPPDTPTRAHLAHLRMELVRQRDLLASAPFWYVLPPSVGVLVMVVGVTLGRLEHGAAVGAALLRSGPSLIVIVGILVGIVIANRRAARALTRAIEALEDRPDKS